MSPITADQARDWTGRQLNGADEDKIGSIDHVYVDRETGEPTFFAVKTGLFGTNVSFVPVSEAREDGDHVDVPYEKSLVKDSPNIADDAELSPEEEQQIYSHYGVGYSGYDGPDYDAAATTGTTGAGHDTSGPNTDDAMTRSEEELTVGKTTRETGRARLRKYVVTENVTTTVPVQREEVRIEREPITDANVGAATDGPAISEEEHEVVLHAEEPVVEKNVVAKERVRMGTETVTDDVEVSDTVRKERIDAENDAEQR